MVEEKEESKCQIINFTDPNNEKSIWKNSKLQGPGHRITENIESASKMYLNSYRYFGDYP